jgi:hypothetical protein
LEYEQFAVSTTNHSSQSEFSSKDSPEKNTLLAHKAVLQRILEQLQPSLGYLKIERGFIEQLLQDLKEVMDYMESIQHNPGISQYFRSRSIEKVFKKIRDDAWVELITSLSYLDDGEKQDYFRCLPRCSDHLKEALKGFKI